MYGLIGEKLGHSYSPRIHRLLGNYPYQLFEIAPAELPRFLQARQFAGLNVTIPYKQSVIPFCSALSPAAQAIGSVNTLLVRADGSLYGDNTDYAGFAYLAKQAGLGFGGKKTLVLGSGGTSRTACAVIRDAGGLPIVISRRGADTYADLATKHADAAIVVNTTPVGMYPHNAAQPVDLALFPALEGVLDVIYNPHRTRLLQQAAMLGIRHSGGLPMLVAQAKYSAERFLDRTIPDERIAEIQAEIRRQTSNVALVGMPGSGKTTVGREVAQILHMPFYDIDAEIEAEAGRTIPEIFARDGEAAFRRLEAAQIARLGKEGGAVLATGGGAVLDAENRYNLRQNALVILLERDLDGLAMEGRPLSKDAAALQALWQTRAALYTAVADMRIPNNASLAACVEAVCEGVKNAFS